MAITEARLKDIWSIGSRCVVLASNSIEHVFTQTSSIGTRGIAGFETKGASTHEIVPFNRLDIVVRVTVGCRECVGKDEPAEWVSALICTVRVQLATIVVGGNVDECLVDETGDLNIVGRLHKLDSGESASRN